MIARPKPVRVIQRKPPKPVRRVPSGLIWGTDTETTGLQIHHGCRPFFVSSACEDGRVLTWEWDVDPMTRTPIIPERERREVMDHVTSNVHVWHNAKFDVRALWKTLEPLGADLKWALKLLGSSEETVIASHVLASGESHKLKDLCLSILDIGDDDQRELQEATNEARRYGRKMGWRIAAKHDPHFPAMKRAPKAGWWVMDTWLPRAVAKHQGRPKDDWFWTVLSRYGSLDAERTVLLWAALREALEDLDLVEHYRTRLKLLPITFKMESTGVTVNKRDLDAAVGEYADKADESKRIAFRMADHKIDNLNSPKQLQGVLFGTFKLKPLKKTKTGWSTDADTLRALQPTLKPSSRPYQFVKHLLLNRKFDKAVDYLGTYNLSGLPVLGTDGAFLHVHPSFNITGTATTRFSSSDPNAQNISKQEEFNLRRVFGPLPGREWWSIDYENIEKRIPAYLADERELIDLFESGGSYHLLVGSIVRKDLFKRLGPDGFKKTQEYRWVKNGNFAEQYGGGEDTVDEAFHVRGGYKMVKDRFRKINALAKEVLREGRRNGSIVTLGGYPLQCPVNERGQVIPTTPFNYFIQGTAGWILINAMIDVDEYLQTLGDEYKLIMTIHDELVFDFPAKDFTFDAQGVPHGGNVDVVRNVVRLMEDAGRRVCGFDTPVDAEVIRTNWAEGSGIRLGAAA